MRKLGLLLCMLAFTAVGAQAQNIIKSLERTVPGQGKVTIHQDPKIEALIGVERPSMGEQKVLKAAGFRIHPINSSQYSIFKIICRHKSMKHSYNAIVSRSC